MNEWKIKSRNVAFAVNEFLKKIEKNIENQNWIDRIFILAVKLYEFKDLRDIDLKVFLKLANTNANSFWVSISTITIVSEWCALVICGKEKICLDIMALKQLDYNTVHFLWF